MTAAFQSDVVYTRNNSCEKSLSKDKLSENSSNFNINESCSSEIPRSANSDPTWASSLLVDASRPSHLCNEPLVCKVL